MLRAFQPVREQKSPKPHNFIIKIFTIKHSLDTLQRVFCSFFDGLNRMGSAECAQLQLNTSYWKPSYRHYPVEVQEYIDDLLQAEPQPVSKWWSAIPARHELQVNLPDPNAYLVLATLVDRVNTTTQVLAYYQQYALTMLDYIARHDSDELDALGVPEARWSLEDKHQLLRTAETMCHELRRFLGSHVQLS